MAQLYCELPSWGLGAATGELVRPPAKGAGAGGGAGGEGSTPGQRRGKPTVSPGRSWVPELLGAKSPDLGQHCGGRQWGSTRGRRPRWPLPCPPWQKWTHKWAVDKAPGGTWQVTVGSGSGGEKGCGLCTQGVGAYREIQSVSRFQSPSTICLSHPCTHTQAQTHACTHARTHAHHPAPGTHLPPNTGQGPSAH